MRKKGRRHGVAVLSADLLLYKYPPPLFQPTLPTSAQTLPRFRQQSVGLTDPQTDEDFAHSVPKD